ncbi:MAG: serine/threonine protein kinase [Candidatus Ornithomonoglobus sp.]
MEKYKILETIASTDNSEIFLVRNIENGRIYIMKRLKHGGTEPYENAMGIQSPHIVRIYEVMGNTVILEYIPGIPLSELGRCAREYEVKDWTLQMCEGVAELHKNGIIHRDIKPSNVMLTDDGVIKLIDLDISRTYKGYRGKDTQYIGTDGYAPPEQYGFAQTDERSDIYAIGAMMFELLTQGSSLRELGAYSGLLKPIIEKCTKLAPDERYQTIGELKRALGGDAERTAVTEVSQRPVAKKQVNSIAVLILIVIILIPLMSAAVVFVPRYIKSFFNSTVTSDCTDRIEIEYGDFDENSMPVGISSLRLENNDPFLKVYVKLTDNQGFSEYTYVTLKFELLDSNGVTLGYEDVYGSMPAGGENVSDGSIYAHVQKDGSYFYDDGIVSTIRLADVKIR